MKPRHNLTLLTAMLLASQAAISAEKPDLPLAGICNGSLEEFRARPDTDAVNGQYQWCGIQRPLGPDMVVRDSTLFHDEDSKAYFIFDTYPIDRSVRRRLYMAGSAHIWLPLQFTSPDSFEMHYLKRWDIRSWSGP